ncbi:MAG: thioredoxin domain-containing protein, partial [Methanobacteriota archaeon]
FKARERRVRPSLDDKILADWNGLAIAALAMAGRIFDNKEHTAMAERAAEFILTKMTGGEGRLLHTYKDGSAGVQGFLEDYAYLVWGLIELYEAAFEPRWLRKAVELTDQMIELFWDDGAGGFYHTAHDSERLIVRKKEVYDGATPSGNSVAAHNLLRISRLTGDTGLMERAAALASAFASTVRQHPAGYAHLLSAAEAAEKGGREVVVTGDPDGADTEEMLSALHGLYEPDMVVLFKPDDGRGAEIASIAPYTADHSTIEGRATAYVCTGQSCRAPTTDPGEMLRQISARP